MSSSFEVLMSNFFIGSWFAVLFYFEFLTYSIGINFYAKTDKIWYGRHLTHFGYEWLR